ncbi:MAG: ABC transporter permease [Bacteroidetes bacterium]|nr:ABC transporter permease [Bacteroidota bacterium]
MIKIFLKSTWRNLKRNKIFGILNIAGLTVGIVCAALIFLWVEYSFEYNTALKDSDKVYIVKNNQKYGDDIYTMDATCGPLAHNMQREIPGFENAVRTLNDQPVFTVNDKSLAQNGMYADSDFFSVFQFPIIEKTSNDFLSNPYNIAISQKMAKAFFGNENALGKSIRYNRKQDFIVAAVYDVPSINMSMQPDWVIPIAYNFSDSSFRKQWSDWGNCGIRTYVTLQDNASVNKINNQLEGYIYSKSDSTVNQSVFLYPYSKLGLYNSFKNGKETSSDGNIKYIKMFSLIAAIILLIACINFMNLSTARSEKRAKEIGLKKTVGVTRHQLIFQFITESILIAMFAVVLSVILLALCVPAFGNLINTPLHLDILKPVHFISLLLLGLICGIVAGSYPAFYLSSFNPVRALKNQTSKKAGRAYISRKVLVVVQFSASIILIIASIVIFHQINYTKDRDLGFNKDNIMVVHSTEALNKKFNVLRQNVLATGMVNDVSMSWSSMFQMYSNGGGFKWSGHDTKKDDALITVEGIAPNYLQLMGVKLKAGRYFYENSKADSNNVIINPSLAKLMGKEGRIGGRIYRSDDGSDAVTIVGITDNIVYNNIFSNPQPAIFFPISDVSFASLFIKLKPGKDVSQQITSIKTAFKNTDSQFPFDYSFLDDDFNHQFSNVLFIGKLALLFGGLAIFISCLGLFGLSAFMAEQRTKEIGVRKVLGASVFSITQLLNRDFLILVGFSYLVAFPLAWWFMKDWLNNYEYRIQISWWIFVLAAFISVMIALITVSFQAIKAAIANPVKSLSTDR